MYPVSANYKIDTNNTLRNYSYIKVTVNMADPDIATSNTTSDNGHLSISNSSDTDLGNFTETSYATMEHNRLILNGLQAFPTEIGDALDFYQGFVSSSISDVNGTFTINPTITTTFTGYVHFAGMSFKFDDILNCYAKQVKIDVYDGITLLASTTHTLSSVDFITPLGVPSSGYCNKIIVTFMGTSIPKRRMRVSYMIFGIMKEFNDSTINNSVWTKEVDLISSKIAINSFEFTSIDMNPVTGLPDYNPDNPTGLWQYIEQSQPVSIYYGYELNSGSVEWVNGGYLFTTGELKSDSNGAISTVTFYTTSVLNQLTDVYYKGVYSATPVSLYSLAQNVLTFADLRPISSGGTTYFIDSALNNIYTSCPIPSVPINQALQLIANAGRCVLYVDRNGCIRIERFNDALQDFELNFSNMTSIPIVSKTPQLKTINTIYTEVKTSPTDESLTKTSISFLTPTECRIEYTDASTSSVTLTGTLSVVGSPLYYAKCCVITLTGSGEIDIFGKKLMYSSNSVNISIGDTGYDCKMENSLINNITDATAYGNWVGNVIKLRNQYTVSNRGYVELDPLDVITTQSLFSTNLESIITSNKITYNGTLSGDIKFIGEGVV